MRVLYAHAAHGPMPPWPDDTEWPRMSPDLIPFMCMLVMSQPDGLEVKVSSL